jgi:hypothetical protein
LDFNLAQGGLVYGVVELGQETFVLDGLGRCHNCH